MQIINFMFIDTHAHLDFPQLASNLEQVLADAKDARVEKIVNVGCNIGSSKKTLELASKYSFIYAAVGINPCDILKDEQQTKQILQMEGLLENREKIVAVGENGLDYHWMEVEPQIQKDMFKAQVEMALSYDLPIIVHCRNSLKNQFSDAYEDAFLIIENVLNEAKKNNVNFKKFNVVFHCFASTLNFAFKVWDKGYFTSFTGIVTYPNAGDLREVVRNAPLDKIMIETDCPFLAPQKFRGKTNMPAYVVENAFEISKIRNLNVLDLEKFLERNSIRFFNLTS